MPQRNSPMGQLSRWKIQPTMTDIELITMLRDALNDYYNADLSPFDKFSEIQRRVWAALAAADAYLEERK